jgi:prepilin-type N-terminal cleavage/methylation domain-containing protein
MKKAYTLIELLVVIAIIAILAAILFPVFSRVQENVRRSTCMSNLKQIHTGVTTFQLDRGRYPEYLFGPAY